MAQTGSESEEKESAAAESEEERRKHHHKSKGQHLTQSAFTDKKLEDYGLLWQNVDHSVTIVGWGVDAKTGTKYWIIRNSYGATWGDKGDFLIEKGRDDFAIESENTTFEPVLCSEGGC